MPKVNSTHAPASADRLFKFTMGGAVAGAALGALLALGSESHMGTASSDELLLEVAELSDTVDRYVANGTGRAELEDLRQAALTEKKRVYVEWDLDRVEMPKTFEKRMASLFDKSYHRSKEDREIDGDDDAARRVETVLTKIDQKLAEVAPKSGS